MKKNYKNLLLLCFLITAITTTKLPLMSDNLSFDDYKFGTNNINYELQLNEDEDVGANPL